MSPSSSTLNPGETDHLVARRHHGNTFCEFAKVPVWSVSDPQVATVARAPTRGGPAYEADVLALRGGIVQITATDAGRVASMELTVSPSSITITPSPVATAVGQSATATAVLRHSDGTAVSLPVTWSILNQNVATVTAGQGGTATVNGVAPGSTQLTATAGTKSATATVNVAGQAQPATLRGRMLGGDDVTALPGMTVRVSGIGTVMTDAQGQYSIDVTPGGSFQLFAQGVCDPTRSCSHERSYNSTELESVSVAAGETKTFDARARRGYHLRLTSGTSDRTVAANTNFAVAVGYEVWNRAGLPGAAPRIAFGVEATAGRDWHVVGVPGAHPPGAAGTGTTNLQLTAPAAAGQYGVYALLVTAAGHLPADSIYRAQFPNAELFVRLFTLTVP